MNLDRIDFIARIANRHHPAPNGADEIALATYYDIHTRFIKDLGDIYQSLPNWELALLIG